MKLYITYLGGLVAFGILLWFARGVWTRKIPASTPASWLMWTIMDGVLLAITLANNKPGWLAGGWTVGAAAVTLALLVRGKWSWSYKETICALAAAISMFFWLQWSAFAGLIAGIIAMNAGGTPNWIDMWRNPIKESWPVWFFTVIACIFTLLGSDWSWAGTLLPASSIIYNGSVTLVVLLKKNRGCTQSVETLQHPK